MTASNSDVFSRLVPFKLGRPLLSATRSTSSLGSGPRFCGRRGFSGLGCGSRRSSIGSDVVFSSLGGYSGLWTGRSPPCAVWHVWRVPRFESGVVAENRSLRLGFLRGGDFWRFRPRVVPASETGFFNALRRVMLVHPEEGHCFSVECLPRPFSRRASEAVIGGESHMSAVSGSAGRPLSGSSSGTPRR